MYDPIKKVAKLGEENRSENVIKGSLGSKFYKFEAMIFHSLNLPNRQHPFNGNFRFWFGNAIENASHQSSNDMIKLIHHISGRNIVSVNISIPQSAFVRGSIILLRCLKKHQSVRRCYQTDELRTVAYHITGS